MCRAASSTVSLACVLLLTACIGPHLRKPPAPGDRTAALKGEPIAVRGESRIRDLAYVTYDVAPERVRSHVPERFELLTRELPEGRRAFLSLVWFRHDDLRAGVPLSPVGAIFKLGTGAPARDARCRVTSSEGKLGGRLVGLNDDRTSPRDQRGLVADPASGRG